MLALFLLTSCGETTSTAAPEPTDHLGNPQASADLPARVIFIDGQQINIVCDTVTGTLLYESDGVYNGRYMVLTAVKDGCPKG